MNHIQLFENFDNMDNKKVKLRLMGLNGNAYSLMGAFSEAAREQGWSKEEIQKVIDKCMSGDYDNLLCTLMDNTEEPDVDPDIEDEDDFEDDFEDEDNW